MASFGTGWFALTMIPCFMKKPMISGTRMASSEERSFTLIGRQISTLSGRATLAVPARFGRFAGGTVAGETTPPRPELHGEASLRLIGLTPDL